MTHPHDALPVEPNGSWPDEKGFPTYTHKCESKGRQVFFAYAATGLSFGRYFSLSAPDMGSLRALWPKLMDSALTLDESQVQEVLIVSRPMLAYLIDAERRLSDGTPKWTPVSERLPDDGVVVLVRVAATPIDNPSPWIGSGRYVCDEFDEVRRWEVAGWLGWGSPHDVTHWMPLAKNPESTEARSKTPPSSVNDGERASPHVAERQSAGERGPSAAGGSPAIALDGEARWTTTGKNCPAIYSTCQDPECWALGEKPCKRWIAGERAESPYAMGKR